MRIVLRFLRKRNTAAAMMAMKTTPPAAPIPALAPVDNPLFVDDSPSACEAAEVLAAAVFAESPLAVSEVGVDLVGMSVDWKLSWNRGAKIVTARRVEVATSLDNVSI